MCSIYIYIYIYIYILIDNFDDVIRHGPYLKDLHNLFPHSYIFFNYAYAFPGCCVTPDVAFV